MPRPVGGVVHFLNSFFVATVVTAIRLLTSALAGYVFAKFRFPGNRIIFLMILSVMMIPGPVFLLPTYQIVRYLGMLNSYWALIVPSLYTPFGIFLMRQYMHSIPTDLVDAARIDGCSEYRIFFQIVLPLCGPVIAALGIFEFMWNWDNLLWPLVVLNKRKLYTLPIGLALFSNHRGSDYALIMAGSTIAVIPVIIVYLIFQRWFIQGIALTGMKS
jgi:multiple sugar transport system permease protein